MFKGRKKELELLEDLYNSKRFEFLVLYGRRRVGKTELLKEFTKNKKPLFFSAQEKNDSLNLLDFSKTVQTYFDNDFFGEFSDWETALKYVTSKATEDRLVIVIDEFPYIASENKSIKSIFQHTIDHQWKEKNIFLVLCGSSVSFMEGEVLGSKSPLYGRSTAHLELKAFDYFDSALFFPEYSNEEKLMAYGILGGIPCYLQAFDSEKPIEKNIAREILREGRFLKDEPIYFLKQELREPAIYNSIFEAIAGGASRVNEIATKIHEDTQKCSKYLGILQTIRLIKKAVPCGEDEASRKTIYKIEDNYFSFWYHFLFEKKSFYEILGPEESAKEIMDPQSFFSYFGSVFETICLEYMIRMAKNRRLPFIPSKYGKWWGNNPARKCQDDIDVLLIDDKNEKYIFCECKFKGESFGKFEMEDMLTRKSIFAHAKEPYFYAFSKSGFSDYVKENASSNNITLVTVDDLFEFGE